MIMAFLNLSDSIVDRILLSSASFTLPTYRGETAGDAPPVVGQLLLPA